MLKFRFKHYNNQTTTLKDKAAVGHEAIDSLLEETLTSSNQKVSWKTSTFLPFPKDTKKMQNENHQKLSGIFVTGNLLNILTSRLFLFGTLYPGSINGENRGNLRKGKVEKVSNSFMLH